MNLEKVKPALPATGKTGPELFCKAANSLVYATPSLPYQAEFSAVAYLAARSGVALSTARLYAELHQFGGARQ